MSQYSKVDHVIFDLDGILLDSETFYVQTATELCNDFNRVFTWELREKAMGLPGLEYSRTIVETLHLPVSPEKYYKLSRQKIEKLFPSAKLMPVQELNLPISPEELLAQQRQLQREMLPKTKLMPGAERLVRHLHKHGVPIAVATSSSEESVALKLTNHKELFSLFHHIVMGSSDPEVKKGKPNPDIFLICASRFSDQPTPEKCLVFEDAPNGVKAAHAAGMQVVMVPDEYISEENKQLATVVLHSLEEFKPELFGLPPY